MADESIDLTNEASSQVAAKAKSSKASKLWKFFDRDPPLGQPRALISRQSARLKVKKQSGFV